MSYIKKTVLSLFILIALSHITVGQVVEDFQLTDAVSGNEFVLSAHSNSKGVILVFTTLTCPFSKLYEERLTQLYNRFAADDFIFALINPNSGTEAEENRAAIRTWASSKNFPIPFLMDDKKQVAKVFGITKLPEVVVITPSQTGSAIAYRGAIDNNPQMPANANIKYLESALTAIQNRKNPSPASSRAVGCNLRLN